MNRYLMSLLMIAGGMFLGGLLETVSMEWNRAIVPEGKTWVLYEFDGPIFGDAEGGRCVFAWNERERIDMDGWR